MHSFLLDEGVAIATTLGCFGRQHHHDDDRMNTHVMTMSIYVIGVEG